MKYSWFGLFREKKIFNNERKINEWSTVDLDCSEKKRIFDNERKIN